MKIKRAFWSMLIIGVLLFSAIGCSSGTQNNSEGNTSNETDTAPEVSEALDSIEIVEDENDEQTINEDVVVIDGSQEPAILVDSNDVYIEYQGIYEPSETIWGLELYIENNSEESILITLNDELINSCRISIANNYNIISADTKYLASANYGYIIEMDKLEEYSISEIKTIEFTIRISPEDSDDAFIEQPVKIELDKDVPTVSENSEIERGDVILDEDDVSVEYRGIREASENYWIIDLYVENNKDSQVVLELSDGLANRYSFNIENAFATIPAHSRYLSYPGYTFIINADALKAYDISEIEDLEFTLKVNASFGGDTICEKDISLSVNQPIG